MWIVVLHSSPIPQVHSDQSELMQVQAFFLLLKVHYYTQLQHFAWFKLMGTAVTVKPHSPSRLPKIQNATLPELWGTLHTIYFDVYAGKQLHGQNLI